MLHSFRYISILRVLEDSGFMEGAHRIAEIGSGISGLSTYIKGRFIGCDLDFPGKTPSGMRPVRCNVFELPFEERSIDFVVSSDMMEHIPPMMRERAVKEMLRVTSKCLIMAFPEGEKARQCDVRINDSLKKGKKSVPSWLIEHLDEKNIFPTTEEIGGILDSTGLRYVAYPNESLLLHAAGVRLENTPAYKKLAWRARNFPARHLWRPLLPLASMGETYRRIFAVYRKVGA
ncbi:MAG TPA: methyltransferase domain-containing protein [Thermodesulfobacteriota bacterium]